MRPLKSIRQGVITLAIFILCASATTSYGADLTPAEVRGRALYFYGTNADGAEVTAYFGDENLELSGAISTCATCHGPDGTGRPESGVDPSNITWTYLSKAYGHQHSNNRQHPAFTPENLKPYLLYGHYPGGAASDPAMPRYDLSEQDLDDLVAFLQRLGENLTPGVDAESIHLATAIPASGQDNSTGESISRLLENYFTRLNQGGGVYGRTIKFTTFRLDLPDEHSDRELTSLFTPDEPFLLLGTFTPGIENSLRRRLTSRNTPLIAPLTLFPADHFPENRWTYYIWAGLQEQMQALLQFLAQNDALKNPRAGLVIPAGKNSAIIAETLQAEISRHDGGELIVCSYPEGELKSESCDQGFRDADLNVVMFLGDERDFPAFLASLDHRPSLAHLLLSGPLIGRSIIQIPPELADKAWISYPTLSFDRKSSAERELKLISPGRGSGRHNLHAKLNAYVAAQLTEYALREAGENLTRENFASSMEKLYKYESGLTPPLTYTRNRHIGARGSYIVRFKQFLSDAPGPPPVWQQLD